MDGSVGYTDNNAEDKTFGQRVIAGYLSLANFANESGLERVGGSLWATTANSGQPIVGTPNTTGYGATVGGELEMSNVDLATEMTKMITAERGYQANSRVITTADTMLETLVCMPTPPLRRVRFDARRREGVARTRDSEELGPGRRQGTLAVPAQG